MKIDKLLTALTNCDPKSTVVIVSSGAGSFDIEGVWISDDAVYIEGV